MLDISIYSKVFRNFSFLKTVVKSCKSKMVVLCLKLPKIANFIAIFSKKSYDFGTKNEIFRVSTKEECLELQKYINQKKVRKSEL